MKCQTMISKKNKKTISKCYLLEFLPSMLSVIEYIMLCACELMLISYTITESIRTCLHMASIISIK